MNKWWWFIPNYRVLDAIHQIDRKVNNIMATQKEEADTLSAIADQLNKAITEITAALANLGNTSPEVDAATDKLKAVAQALDDLNPDAPAP